MTGNQCEHEWKLAGATVDTCPSFWPERCNKCGWFRMNSDDPKSATEARPER